MTTAQITNQYFVCFQNSPLEPVLWPIAHADCDKEMAALDPSCSYFGQVFRTVEQRLTLKGLTFYLTWDIDRLPSYGDNVVVVLLGDEHCRIPSYIDKVGVIFKDMSTRPILGSNLLLRPSYLNLMIFLQFLRNWIKRTPGLLKCWLSSFKRAKIAPIYDVPLGYYKQDSLPVKNISGRRYDLFFAGSLISTPYPIWSWRRWLQGPKDIARKEMLLAIEKLQTKYPKLRIAVGTTNDFGEEANFLADNRSYSEKLMDTKVCLCPRGSTFETNRYFEGLRYGCIVVAQPLPKSWFYQNSPAIQTLSWGELEQIARELLPNESLMQLKHEESLIYWQEKCSELAVGIFIAEKINN